MKTDPGLDDLDPADEFEMVQELLPWYAQGTLEGAELAFVQQWLALHMTEHPEIAAELAWLRSSATHLQAAASAQMQQTMSDGAMDLGLAALMQRIAQERAPEAALPVANKTASKPPVRPGSSQTKDSWLVRFGDWLHERFGMLSPAPAFAAVALILVQAGVIGVLLLQKPADQEALSGPPGLVTPANAALLTVAFNPQSREQDIRQTLLNAKATIVSGPSALGLYVLSVSADQLAQSMSQLQAAKGIVESVQR
ncbi:MAG: hypothetical protein V4772_03460 [Pseudomonadota bacterium]